MTTIGIKTNFTPQDRMDFIKRVMEENEARDREDAIAAENLKKIQSYPPVKHAFPKGSRVYWLYNYDWEWGTVVKCNTKTVTLTDSWGNTRKVPNEKVAGPEERVVVVSELWKGKNGRGGYRVEREMHDEFRIPAKDIKNWTWDIPGKVQEFKPGILHHRVIE
jgi:hypothetical protein